MSNRENATRNPTQNVIGLDIGTSRIVTARRANDQYQFATQLNAFLTLPYSKITASVLEKENLPAIRPLLLTNEDVSSYTETLLSVDTNYLP